jgi:Tol biopolymer transport system component
VTYHEISPDGSRVLYWADQDIDQVTELYSVPIDGGTPVKLNTPLVAGRAVIPAVQSHVSPDGSRVVYMADQDTNDVFELYSVPIAGGAVTKLNGPLVSGGQVNFLFTFSPDSSRVVYIADQETNDVRELYSVPLAGGLATKLNRPLVAGGDVSSLRISRDSRRVYYSADQDIDGVTELYSVPLAGPAEAGGKLNSPLIVGRSIQSFALSPEGSRIVYTADQDTDNTFELYSMPAAGGAVTKVNTPVIPGGGVRSFAFGPDGRTVLYSARQDSTQIELYLGDNGALAPVHRLYAPALRR